MDSKPLGYLEGRKHLEAVRVDLANRLQIDPMQLRDDIKRVLIDAKIIAFSTTELSDEQLEAYANKLHTYVFHFDENPPEDRRPFDLKALLLS